MEDINLMLGDNIESLKKLNSNSVDSIVTDPPYGLSFMNNKWDYQVPSVEFWKEVYRVLKPGGHILSFGGTRTYHRMVVNIEDAGFEIRDQIQWIYGSGFPKSHNIGKSVDKLLGNEREVIDKVFPDGSKPRETQQLKIYNDNDKYIGAPKYTKGNSDYEGWGTALKPANEPICLARKPLSEKTVAENVIKYSTGGINIDGCRIGFSDGEDKKNFINDSDGINRQKNSKVRETYMNNTNIIGNHNINDNRQDGRWPSNIIFDEEAAKLLDEQSGNSSRFFYQAKVSKTERNISINTNNHPTVKPINLMTYLCRLITPKGGVVLDPFMGSGSSGISACLEGFKFIGMEMDEDYFKIAQARINNFEQYRKLLK